MEFKKIINLVGNTPNQWSKFRTKNWVKINDDARGTHNTNSQIKFETKMCKSSLCDDSDTYIFVKGTINCAPFTDFVIQISSSQVDNAKDLNKMMLIYNLIEYSDNYSKTSRSLWQYFRDEPGKTDNPAIIDSESFKSKTKAMEKTLIMLKKDVRIAVLLKYLSNFWKTIEMLLINCKINLILTWSANCVIGNSTGTGAFTIQ